MLSFINTNLHEARNGLYGVVGFIEDISPGVDRSCVFFVNWGLREECCYIWHAQLRPTKLGVKEHSAGIILEQGLEKEKVTFNNKYNQSNNAGFD